MEQLCVTMCNRGSIYWLVGVFGVVVVSLWVLFFDMVNSLVAVIVAFQMAWFFILLSAELGASSFRGFYGDSICSENATSIVMSGCMMVHYIMRNGRYYKNLYGTTVTLTTHRDPYVAVTNISGGSLVHKLSRLNPKTKNPNTKIFVGRLVDALYIIGSGMPLLRPHTPRRLIFVC